MSALAVAEFDALPGAEANAVIRDACASRVWQVAIVAARPYVDLPGVVMRSDETVAGLAWTDVEQALSTHPRIGERAGGGDRESAWSRAEQSGAADAGRAVAAELERRNRDYEQRFGFVFLICATGLTSEQMLSALTVRLDNDVAVEQKVVRRELAAIVGLRLGKVLA